MWATSGAQNLKSMRLDGTDNSFLIRFLSSHLATLKNQVAGHMGIWTFVTFLEFCEKSEFISKCPNLHRLLKITKGKQIIQNKNSCYLQRDFLLITELEFKLFLICLTKVCTPWSGSSVGRNIVLYTEELWARFLVRGTYLARRFDPWLGCTWEAPDGGFSPTSMFFSLSLPLSLKNQ